MTENITRLLGIARKFLNRASNEIQPNSPKQQFLFGAVTGFAAANVKTARVVSLFTMSLVLLLGVSTRKEQKQEKGTSIEFTLKYQN